MRCLAALLGVYSASPLVLKASDYTMATSPRRYGYIRNVSIVSRSNGLGTQEANTPEFRNMAIIS